MRKLALSAALVLAAPAFAQAPTNLFGFELGSVLNAPPCPNIYAHPKDGYCLVQNPMKRLRQGEGGMSGLATLHFKYNELPFWTASKLEVYLIDGKIEGLMSTTGGRTTNLSVTDDLHAKFGEPTSKIPGQAQNAMGARYDSTISRWDFPNLTVSYLPVFGDVKTGRVLVFTKAGNEAYTRELDSGMKAARPL
jgi:hypothetical protein